MREHHATVVELGFGLDELKAMGLNEPAFAEPAQLVGAYLRRETDEGRFE